MPDAVPPGPSPSDPPSPGGERVDRDERRRRRAAAAQAPQDPAPRSRAAERRAGASPAVPPPPELAITPRYALRVALDLRMAGADRATVDERLRTLYGVADTASTLDAVFGRSS